MMRHLSILLAISLLVCAASLGSGYLLSGDWWIMAVLPGLVGAWFLTKKYSVFWSASSILFCIVILSTLGILSEKDDILMILSITSGLVSWDLALKTISYSPGLPKASETTPDKNYISSLSLAAAGGFVLALASLYVDLNLSFGLILLLGLISIAGIVFGVKTILKQ